MITSMFWPLTFNLPPPPLPTPPTPSHPLWSSSLLPRCFGFLTHKEYLIPDKETEGSQNISYHMERTLSVATKYLIQNKENPAGGFKVSHMKEREPCRWLQSISYETKRTLPVATKYLIRNKEDPASGYKICHYAVVEKSSLHKALVVTKDS